MSTPPAPVPSLPSWPYCGHGADPATDPVGCPGIHAPGHTACLAHLNDTDRDAYLTTLAPGSDIDHRGTPFTAPLLQALLQVLHDPTTQKPRFGTAQFDGAQFSDTAHFGRAQFFGVADFWGARFTRGAWFVKAQFSDTAFFREARFSDTADFGEARFSGAAHFVDAWISGTADFGEAWFSDTAQFELALFCGATRFDGARFSSAAWFDGTQFFDTADFGRAQFSDIADFEQSKFSQDVHFGQAQFAVMSWFGPLVCAGAVDLSGAVFDVPVTLEIAAGAVRCERTRWESTATLRLRYATADLSHAVLSSPVAVTAHPAPFTSLGWAVDESLLAGAGAKSSVRVVSVRAHLVLTDTDLTDCLFSGAFHLDQLRLEGRCTFALTPAGLHRRHCIWPYWWTRRRTLAEEHH
ncbi:MULTISPECIES: pentapeptide repeat-containing protein [Streptomyces]|uniref:pentapeptide repeat-containing protein n=1 Tax=Streptomyces TaxID=1883 RepID=UPI00269BAD86|nr:pentapeptide repeat-containing protein [Streptomyces rhizosphaericus]